MIGIQPAIDTILGIVNGFIAAIPNILLAAIVVGIAASIGNVVRNSSTTIAERSGLKEGATLIVSRFARLVVIGFGLLIASSIAFPDVGPTQLLELLGIGTIAIGFAFQDIFQNFLAGILILLTQPFEVGDQIIMDDYEGTVEDIKIRATNIRTYDQRLVVIPNSNLFTNSVTVNTAYEYMRCQYDININYQEDIEKAREVILNGINRVDAVLTDPAPEVLVVELDLDAIVFRMLWWAHPDYENRIRITDKVITSVKYSLDEAGIEPPDEILMLSGRD